MDRLELDDALIAALHEGPFEDSLWNDFLNKWRVRMRADYTGIIFRPPDRPFAQVLEFFSGRRAPAELQKLYDEQLYKVDPFETLHLQLQEGRVYALPELLNEADPMHAAFRRTMLEPSGINFMRLIRVTEPSGVSAWLSMARADEDFSAAEEELLARLTKHFRQSLRSRIVLERQRQQSSVADDVFSRLNFGWITIDTTGSIVEVSPSAHRMMVQNPGLTISKNGRLNANSPAVQRKLFASLTHICSAVAPRPRALNISDDPWLNLLLVPLVRPAISTARTPVMIAYLQGDTRTTADRHEQIAELFGLLPSEARLAWALSRGQSIAEAAENLSLTIGTARNYSKKIYSKMGARGQADLVRFILSSVLALA
ncbi:hypothetical protein [Acidocella sp. KAb 2-4]|uniref:helix-turn-helix transcriptional regulator n=1 Tax=Acidocella sp. KAb 2-4 TaxID=2885158 RepID=UPI001D078349|nr:hypothetical protein [Acidocella sp. KAb 2-4]MCB5945201.1 hypothetical protein [Acidocella sp. KAb 2-4]